MAGQPFTAIKSIDLWGEDVVLNNMTAYEGQIGSSIDGTLVNFGTDGVVVAASSTVSLSVVAETTSAMTGSRLDAAEPAARVRIE